MKALAKLFKFLIFFVFLSGLALIGFMLWIDPNEFKTDLSQLVLDKTGHTLKIEGPVQWSFFPGIGLKFQKAHFEMNPKVSAPLKIKTLNIQEGKTQIAFFPILMKRLAVEKVWLKEIALDLNNNTEHAHIQTLSLSGLDFSAADNLSLSEINIQQAKLFKGKNKTPEIVVDLYTKKFHFKKKKLRGHFKLKVKKNGLTATLQTQAKVDLGTDTLKLRSFAAHFANATITGAADIQSFSEKTPNVKIQATLKKTNINELLQALDVTFNPAEHPKTLAANASLQLTNNNLTLDTLNLDLDDGTLTGTGQQHQTQDFKFNIQAQKLNLDKLLALQTAIYRSPILTSATSSIQTTQAKSSPKPASEPTPAVLFPMETLRTLKLSGSFRGQNLTFNKILINDLQAKIKSRQGITHINPILIKTLASQHHFNITLNAQGTTPKITLTEKSDPFEISTLTKAFSPKKQISGTTTLKLNLKTSGQTPEALEKNLTGNIDFQVADGALYGIDLDAVLAQAQTTVEKLFQALKRTSSKKLTSFLGTEIKQWKTPIMNENATTPFHTLQGNFQVKNRTLYNSALNLNHTNYKITGQGQYNIASNFVQYRALAYLLQSKQNTDPAITEFMAAAPVPVIIRGPLENLSFKPELSSFTQNAAQHFQKRALKQAIKKPLNKLLEKFRNKKSNTENENEGGSGGLPISLDSLFR